MPTCRDAPPGQLSEESRGFHYREDFPEMDDRNWLMWVMIRNREGKMHLSTEDIPLPYVRPEGWGGSAK